MKRFTTEFISVFFAVILAFALNNWNDDRRAKLAEEKILKEILAGLDLDARDAQANIGGHEVALNSSRMWMAFLNGKEVPMDTLGMVYAYAMFRDYISIQNTTGYEALKSRGLELVEDDSLRTAIVSLYEYDYEVIKLFEEEYQEMQYFANYFPEFNTIVSPYVTMEPSGKVNGIKESATFSEEEVQTLKLSLDRMQFNRKFVLNFYQDVLRKIERLEGDIRSYLEE